MAYPDGVSLAVLNVGSAFTAFGTNEPFTFTVTPVFPKAGKGVLARIVHEPSGWLMSNTPEEFHGATGSSVSFSVPHVDQAGFRDPAGNAYTGWHYVVSVKIGGRGRKSSTYDQIIRPIVGQDLIDVDLVPDGESGEPSSVPAPAVTSVNGQTGAVQVDLGESITDPEIAELMDNPESAVGYTLANYISSNAVTSVNGQTGAVVITAATAPVVTEVEPGVYMIEGA